MLATNETKHEEEKIALLSNVKDAIGIIIRISSTNHIKPVGFFS